SRSRGDEVPDEVAAAVYALVRVSAEGPQSGPGADISASLKEEPLTTDDVAWVLGVSPRQVTRLRASGALTGRQDGRRWLFDVADVERLKESRDGRTTVERGRPKSDSRSGRQGTALAARQGP